MRKLFIMVFIINVISCHNSDQSHSEKKECPLNPKRSQEIPQDYEEPSSKKQKIPHPIQNTQPSEEVKNRVSLSKKCSLKPQENTMDDPLEELSLLSDDPSQGEDKNLDDDDFQLPPSLGYISKEEANLFNDLNLSEDELSRFIILNKLKYQFFNEGNPAHQAQIGKTMLRYVSFDEKQGFRDVILFLKNYYSYSNEEIDLMLTYQKK